MLAFEFLYHAIVIVYELVFVRPRLLPMLPRLQDIRDGLTSVGYLSTLRREKPSFGRYDFRQKVEYWAMIWGLVIMGATGFILMFAVVVTRYLPGVFVSAAKVAHGYEAILAFLAIVTWHLYNAHLSLGAFPLDTTIFTGKISRKRMLEEHPLECARLTTGQSRAPSGGSAEEK
jgi:cytochrome b subunit of formate dehydrogenase